MKLTPPPSVQGLTFDELVARAQASEPTLSPSDLDRMVARFETRLRAEGAGHALQPQAHAVGGAGQNASAGKWSTTTKAMLSGAGLAAVAAFIYGVSTLPTQAPHDTVTQHTHDAERPSEPSASVQVVSQRGVELAQATPDETPGSVEAPNGSVDDEALEDGPVAPARPSTKPKRPAPSAARSVQADAPSKSASQATAVSQPHATENASASAGPSITAEPPAPAKPTASLDTSLEQLERAERELRSGNPKAALNTLALPVVSSLSSRVEALRAVALCQSGQTAAGRRLGTQHLVRNPRSPYEQRLQRACGDI